MKMTNIFFQNGFFRIKNANSVFRKNEHFAQQNLGQDKNFEGALASANLIKNLTGVEVGLIVNNTNPNLNVVGDTLEYLPNGLYLFG